MAGVGLCLTSGSGGMYCMEDVHMHTGSLDSPACRKVACHKSFAPVDERYAPSVTVFAVHRVAMQCMCFFLQNVAHHACSQLQGAAARSHRQSNS